MYCCFLIVLADVSVWRSPRPFHSIEPLIALTSVTSLSHVRILLLRLQMAFPGAIDSTSSTPWSKEWRVRENSLVSYESNQTGLFDGVVSSVSSHLSNIQLPVDPVGDYCFIARRMIYISRCILRLRNNIMCFCYTSLGRLFRLFNPSVIMHSCHSAMIM